MCEAFSQLGQDEPASGARGRAWGELPAAHHLVWQGLLESKETHRPWKGPMLLGTDLP